ncbi:UDP-N-acetylmuramoyl-L-alanine--D-glutamate ligase [Microlunatus sp. Y2014]|uniref:UDP-N-acetylmuramoyl-L-alanine--D-glutamate ligase n=1 Tax=Microlunatus sp. Y2014 TaxID=3418488 RepID=UPI003DA78178
MGDRTMTTKDFLTGERPTADADSDWSQVKALVVGLGVSGFAAADGLLEFDAAVEVVEDRDDDGTTERGTLLETLGATVRLGAGATTAALPDDIDLVVTSPGLSPTFPLLAEAAARGVPIWGEPELAWRLSGPDPRRTDTDRRRTPWLVVTGTNGKTTTVQMLAAMLTAAGLRTAAVGNVGRPVMETVLDPEPYDVLAVELSSFQLHWSNSLQPHSSAVLNVHPDHLEWYAAAPGADTDPMAAYVADKALAYERVTHSCVYNVADPRTEELVAEADVVEGARAIGFTLGTPGMSMLGVVDDLLVDRAFVEQRRTSAMELAAVADVTPNAPHNVANALAAAALARSYGVRPTAVRDGLRSVELGGHRIAEVATVAGVRYVDDSKATNPHAALASLQAYDHVVWIAGGQAKGTSFDDLVATVGDRLRGVVLFGVDRHVIADALARHAPEVPTQMINSTDTGTMARVVEAAARLARTDDVVLLAPGCASKDMYDSYAARGDAFAEAVRRRRVGDDPVVDDIVGEEKEQ